MKNRTNVALSTAKPPQIHCTRVVPKYGIAESRLVITVAPQKDIWPQGRTYPTKAVAITVSIMITPIDHVVINLYEPKYMPRPVCRYMQMKNSDAPFACKVRRVQPLFTSRQI